MFGGLEDSDRCRLIQAAALIGVTAAVYLVFRYIVFLVAPFLVGFLITMIIRKPVDFMHKRLRINKIIGVIIMLLLVAAAVTGFIVYVGGKFVAEARSFMASYDLYYRRAEGMVCNMCCSVDRMLGLSEGKSFSVLKYNIKETMDGAGRGIIQVMWSNSFNVVSQIIIWGGGIAIALTSVFFMIRDMDRFSEWTKNGPYGKWIKIAFGRLTIFGTAYVKTQLVIMGITALLCTIAMYIIGNGYPVMMGILIGLLDALPLFGTGTVLIPWTLVYLVSGNFLGAAVIFTAYCMCYIVREVLEPKMMGGSMGIHPLIMLVTMYAGVWLFGILGFIYGPCAYIIICEIMKYIAKII